ncbi:hypothetical protein D3C71_1913060 [compost metagenome]
MVIQDLVARAIHNNFAVFQHDDAIDQFQNRQTMCRHHQRSPVAEPVFEMMDKLLFAHFIKPGGRLIKQQNLRRGE